PAYGKRIAVAAEHEHMQVRPAQGNAAGKGQRAAVNVMHAVRLHEIRETARTTNARDGRDLFVPELALLDQFEVKRQHGKITAAGTPGRVVGGDVFFRERLSFGIGQRRDDGNVAVARGDLSYR